MKKRGVLLGIAIVSIVFILSGNTVSAKGMGHDTNAAKQIELIRRNLSGLTQMKAADSKGHYESALKDLQTITEKYAGTEESLEAKFYIGNVYNELHKYDDAVKWFDAVLSYGEIDNNFKARALYFKAKALIGKGDIASAKEAVTQLRTVEPMAADSFGNELSGTMRIGTEAPAFNVADCTGKTVDLAKYKGNLTILTFWATWCDPCIQEFPKIKKMYGKFKEQGVQIIGISLDDDIEDLRGFVNQEAIDWPQIFDGKRWKGAIPSLYHVNILPTFVALDRENKVRYVGGDTDALTQIITTLLAESKNLPLFR